MKSLFTSFVLLIATLRVSAQLSVGASGMTIVSGTPVAVDGLTLTPSADLTISNNSIQKANSAGAGRPNGSINRAYQFDSPLTFSGSLGVYYLPSEVNGLNEYLLQVVYKPNARATFVLLKNSKVNTTTHYVSNSVTNQSLFVVTAAVPSDLTPIIYGRPSNVRNTTPVTVVVDVLELNSVETSGKVTVKITKDPLVSLSFPASSMSVGGRTVQNSAWIFDEDSDPSYYYLTTTTPVPAGDQLSFGLEGTLTPGATQGILTFSATISSGNDEVKLNNNTDGDKIEYFQQ